MKIGTRSILFGVHQFLIHPWFVAWAWWELYGFPWDPRLWVAFFVHDLGYFGKPNMDGEEGEMHPFVGAGIMGWLFDIRGWRGDRDIIARIFNCIWGKRDLYWEGRTTTYNWYCFTFYHSRFLSKKYGTQPSRLCHADKLSLYYTWSWLYLLLARASGELAEYMLGQGARTPALDRDPKRWLADIKRFCREYALAHKDGLVDEWTGTKRDLAIEE